MTVAFGAYPKRMQAKATMVDKISTSGASKGLKPMCALLILGLAVGVVGCGSPKSGDGDAAHASHGGSHAALELNNGKKWQVDPPMMAHIHNIRNPVMAFKSSAEQDHAALAATVQENLGRLVENCTMEGKAHDELHKWLMPFLGLSADYVKATTPVVQQAKYAEIRNALTVFDQYFE